VWCIVLCSPLLWCGGVSDGMTQIEWKHAKYGGAYLQKVVTSLYSGVSLAIPFSDAIEWLELANLCTFVTLMTVVFQMFAVLLIKEL
jgi:hypothetical protein